MKILVYDIETSPNLAHVWDIFSKHGVNPQQIIIPTEVLSFAAKWYGEKEVEFHAQWTSDGASRDDRYYNMMKRMHTLLDEADAAVTYNGNRFDRLHVNREFVERKWNPPSPYRDIDLYRVVKQKFKFPSSSLNYVSQQLGIGSKVKHTGYELWRSILVDDDPKAKALMQKYNIGDVKLTEKLYAWLLPWIDQHPNHATYSEKFVCRNCGSDNVQKRGLAYTTQRTYHRFQCLKCGTWGRAARQDGTGMSGVRA